jgi:hypothetical protein
LEGFSTIVNSILTLGLAMLVGFVCVKTGYITEEQKNALSKIIVKVTLPILVVTSLTKLELNHEKIVNSVYVLILALIIIGVMYAIGQLVSKLFHMDKKRAVMHSCMSCFGNVVFMAYPLIQALYGEEGLLYAAIFALANDLYLWTMGVYKMASTESGETSIKKNLKNLINPATIGFVISFFMMITGLKFTGVIKDVLTGIGSTTTYLSMLFIGGTLALVDFRHIYKRVSLFVLVAIKMIALPICLIAILKLFNINDIVKYVVILQAAIPSSTVLTILATEYNTDVIYSAEGVFITTIASLFTLPIVYYLMML